jgi:hypothetical protein
VGFDHSQGYFFYKPRKFLLLGKIPEDPPDEQDVPFRILLGQEELVEDL